MMLASSIGSQPLPIGLVESPFTPPPDLQTLLGSSQPLPAILLQTSPKV
jgi:hypothetical protein